MKISNIIPALSILSATQAFPLFNLFKKQEESVREVSFGFTKQANFNGTANATEISNSTYTYPTNSSSNITVISSTSTVLFKPQVVVVNMFTYEQEPWLANFEFVNNITLPGLSPLYPQVHCVANYSICQVTTGEGEINAATTITALTLSPLFDWSQTYFLIAGIAGSTNPGLATLGSVTAPRFAVQVGLEYEIDSTELPPNSNWTSGYFAYDTKNQTSYPGSVYGTEVFELNEALRDRVVKVAKTVTLSNGTEGNYNFRQLYPQQAAKNSPAIVKCDTLTSDTYWAGNDLTNYFNNFTQLISNKTATACSTQQEDNASLEAFTRVAKHGLVDFDRIVILRSISDFSAPPPAYANATLEFFTSVSQGGSKVAVDNLYTAGVAFVEDVVSNWDGLYSVGAFKPENYVGDYLATLGGKPDFGTYRR